MVSDRLVLTAAHVCVDAGLALGDRVEVCLLGSRWVTASVAWLSAEVDVGLVRVDETESWSAPGISMLRWGRLTGAEPVAAAAIGFPWAQQRPDMVRDTEHVVGFVAPGTAQQSKLLHLTVLSSAPAERLAVSVPVPDSSGAASAWAGMSGAALLVGPYLVGMVIADPARYERNRLVVMPTGRILAAAGFAEALKDQPRVVEVGAAWRWQFAQGKSLSLAWPYRPLPSGFNAAAARHRLCNPEHAIVPFAGRDDLVAGLVGWCSAGGAKLAIRTITGSGGSGKTRLAAEVCVAVAGLGLDAGFADVDRAGGTTRWELEQPTMLVVDNADLNVSLVADLIRTLAYTDVPVRLLLLARSRDPWWSMLETATESLVDGFDDGDLSLTANVLAPPERYDHFRAACTAFATVLTGGLDPVAARPEPPDLAGDVFGDPLMVHVAALLAVSGDPLGPLPGADQHIRSSVLRAMLNREASRWPRQVADGGLTEPVVLRRCVATATISSPESEQPAATTLTAVPDLAADSENSRRYTLARWLHTLDPGPDYWNPLRPDPLADQLLADLDVLPLLTMTIARNAIEQADHHTIDRLLAELTRASAATGGMATQALNELLHHLLGDILDTTLAAPESPLAQRLTTALQQSPVPDTAATTVDQLPEHSLAFADLAHLLTAQAVDHYRACTATEPDSFMPDLAGSLNNLSNRLADVGRREDALTTVEESVTVYRGLATARPDAFLPDLATSLNNLSNRLADVGRREDALTTIEESVTIRRGLATARPDAFLPDLAMSLNNLSAQLAGVGRREDALTAIEESVTVHRALAAARPDVFLSYLAMSLNNLSAQLAGVGRQEDALTTVEESVTVHRALAAARPDAFMPDLAMSLSNLSVVLADVGRREDALTAVEESVTVYRALAADDEFFLPELAKSLLSQGIRLTEVRNFETALTCDREAVSIYAKLYKVDGDIHRKSLEQAVRNYAIDLKDVGRSDQEIADEIKRLGLF
ncbi:tetratricopeptide repeat-containing serine protease family protein [Nocardia sp. NPDC059246]|uniref:tetratricopeptide repeat-containing serine protease family protein n=1 Tax=Nocardia sp. NPDC059246 TaxID=3346789 RepID=UPI0036BAEAEB